MIEQESTGNSQSLRSIPGWFSQVVDPANLQHLGSTWLWAERDHHGYPMHIDCLVVTGTMEFYDFPFSWEFHNGDSWWFIGNSPTKMEVSKKEIPSGNFPYIGNFIIPTDELHHFSEG
jgi:hypothetical protein